MNAVLTFIGGFVVGLFSAYLVYYWFVREEEEIKPEPEDSPYTGPRYERPRPLTENELYLRRLKDGK